MAGSHGSPKASRGQRTGIYAGYKLEMNENFGVSATADALYLPGRARRGWFGTIPSQDHFEDRFQDYPKPLVLFVRAAGSSRELLNQNHTRIIDF